MSGVGSVHPELAFITELIDPSMRNDLLLQKRPTYSQNRTQGFPAHFPHRLMSALLSSEIADRRILLIILAPGRTPNKFPSVAEHRREVFESLGPIHSYPERIHLMGVTTAVCQHHCKRRQTHRIDPEFSHEFD